MADGLVSFGAGNRRGSGQGREEMLFLTVRAAPDLVKRFRGHFARLEDHQVPTAKEANSLVIHGRTPKGDPWRLT
jgi:hypothetical protein